SLLRNLWHVPNPAARKDFPSKACPEAQCYLSHSTCNFAGYKRFSSDRAFMIEQDTVTCIHIIRLTIVYGNPISIHLGDGVGAPGIKRRCFTLWNRLYQSI